MENFIHFLKQVTPISTQSLEAVRTKLKVQYFPKNHILIREGDVCNRLYFIDKGLARIFYYKDGKEITDWFGTEHTFISSIVGFFAHKPSPHIVEILEDCKLVSIDSQELDKLYTQYHDLEKAGRLLAIDTVLRLQARIDAMHFESAKQRYEKLLEQHPTLLNRVSLGHIASYLGITQVTLSRIRSKS
ncbi:Crp/Fnr family transcriptional regulator [Flexibacter flexilis]|nr:Crp/Fnr family transcriptional regulator [Flexibacter flexilis]